MKKITFFVLLSILSYTLYSQCINNTLNSSVASTNDGFVQTLSSDVETNEYVTVTGLIIGHNYQFSSTRTGNDDYITITDGANDVKANGGSPLVVNNIQFSTIRVHIKVDAACNTDAFFHMVTLVDLTVAPTTCQKPELGSLGISYKSNTRIDVYWNPPLLGSPPSGYDWEIVPDGNAPGVGTVAYGFVNAPTTNFSSGDVLSPSTAYDIYLRSNCVGEGYGIGEYYLTKTDNIPGFTTNSGPPPANDLCSSAITIIEQTNIPNAAAAAPTAGALLGAATDIVAEACGGITGNALDDVWYKFVAQTTNVHITVEPSPLVDVVVTLYGGDCNSLSYLACSDANSESPSSEEINFSGLTIGQTYYTRTYYYYLTSPSTPAFNIKIWTPDAPLGMKEFEKYDFSYYPNPVSSSLILKAKIKIDKVSVYNMLGQEVMKTYPNHIEGKIDMTNLQNGLYFVKVLISSSIRTIQIIKK